MRAYEFSIIKELIEPKAPGNLKKSTITKAGTQGSPVKINQRQFTTSKGNVVKVHFKPFIEDNLKAVDVSFFVNDTMDDEASGQRDSEILPQVLHTVLAYAKTSKVQRITFSAVAGSGDTKTKFNIPLDRHVASLKSAIAVFYKKLIAIEITPEMEKDELDRVNAIYAKIGKPLKTSATVMYKDELIAVLKQIMDFIDNLTPSENSGNEFNALYQEFMKYIKRTDNWPEFHALLKEFSNMAAVLYSYTKHGAMISKNRRLDLYTKLVQRYFAKDWDISITGTSFGLTRK
jgi:hypothetical protein